MQREGRKKLIVEKMLKTSFSVQDGNGCLVAERERRVLFLDTLCKSIKKGKSEESSEECSEEYHSGIEGKIK